MIGRPQDHTGPTTLRARTWESVETHVLLSVMALVAVAVTAKCQGNPALTDAPSRIL